MTALDHGLMPIAVQRPGMQSAIIVYRYLGSNLASLRDDGWEFPRVRIGMSLFGAAWIEEHLIGAAPRRAV